MIEHSTLVRRTRGRAPTVSAECSCAWSTGAPVPATEAAVEEIEQAEEHHREEVGL